LVVKIALVLLFFLLFDTEIVELCEDDSDWREHVVLQKKKDGKTRFTCYFKHMGPETCEKYQHPLSLIQEILDNLRKVFYKNRFYGRLLPYSY
jgi:hypothetical protein